MYRNKWPNHISFSGVPNQGEPGPCSLLFLIFAVVIISHIYLMPLLPLLRACFALGRWFPNTNCGRFLYLRFFILQSRFLDTLVSLCTRLSDYPSLPCPSLAFYFVVWEKTIARRVSGVGTEAAPGQIGPVSQFCLKSTLPWNSKLCPWPWLLTPFPSLPSLSKCSANRMPKETSFSCMPTFDQDFCFFQHESFQNLLSSMVSDLCSCWPRGQVLLG